MGPQKAIHATGNLILRLCYHILVSGIEYEEREVTVKTLERELQALK